MAAILSRPHCVFVFVFVFDELYLYLYLYLIRFLLVYLYLYLYLNLGEKNVFVFVFVFDKTYLTPALVSNNSNIIGSGIGLCGLMPDGTKPLPEPMLICEQWNHQWTHLNEITINIEGIQVAKMQEKLGFENHHFVQAPVKFFKAVLCYDVLSLKICI